MRHACRRYRGATNGQRIRPKPGCRADRSVACVVRPCSCRLLRTGSAAGAGCAARSRGTGRSAATSAATCTGGTCAGSARSAGGPCTAAALLAAARKREAERRCDCQNFRGLKHYVHGDSFHFEPVEEPAPPVEPAPLPPAPPDAPVDEEPLSAPEVPDAPVEPPPCCPQPARARPRAASTAKSFDDLSIVCMIAPFILILRLIYCRSCRNCPRNRMSLRRMRRMSLSRKLRTNLKRCRHFFFHSPQKQRPMQPQPETPLK